MEAFMIGFIRCIAIVSLLAAVISPASAVPCKDVDLKNLNANRANMIRGMEDVIASLQRSDTKTVAKLGKWLGVVNLDQQKKVVDGLIASVPLAKGMSFECDYANETNTRGAIAWVADGDSFILTAAAHYFTYPETGEDSQIAYMFHEVTHFGVGMNTNPFINRNQVPAETYIRADVLKLAQAKPSEAQQNATSYEFFLMDFMFGP
jgi:hypothetical protein